jgi:hypothetical protein
MRKVVFLIYVYTNIHTSNDFILFIIFIFENNKKSKHKRLIGVSNTSHTTHHAKHVVVDGIDSDLGSGSSLNSSGRKNKLKNSIVNTREVACSRWLVFLWAKSEGVDVNTSIRGTGVVLEGLDNIEV